MNFAGGVRWTLRGDDLTIQQSSVVILNELYAGSRRKHEWKVGIYNTGPYFLKMTQNMKQKAARSTVVKLGNITFTSQLFYE